MARKTMKPKEQTELFGPVPERTRPMLERITGSVSTAEERQEWLSDLVLGRIEDVYVNGYGEIVSRPASLAIRLKACELLARMRGEIQTRATIDQDSGGLVIEVVKFGKERKE